MKFDEIIAELGLRTNLTFNFVRGVDSRLVDKRARGVDSRSEQPASVNLVAPFQHHRRAAEVDNRRDAVSEVDGRIAEIVTRGHQWTSDDMHMRVRQPRNEILPGAVYDRRTCWQADLGCASDRCNAIAAH